MVPPLRLLLLLLLLLLPEPPESVSFALPAIPGFRGEGDSFASDCRKRRQEEG